MVHAPLIRPPRPDRNRLAKIGEGAAWLVGIGAAVRIAEIVVAKSPLLAAAVSALIVDLAATRAGVRWEGSPGKKTPAPPATPTKMSAYAREVGLGLGLGLAVTTVALGVSLAAGWARAEVGAIVGGLLFGGARAAAIAVRDELLYRGVVLFFAARAGLPPRLAVGYAALAGAAALALAPGASAGSVLVALAAGAAYATLWLSRRGAFAAIAAHAGWGLFAGAGVHGALVEATFASGDLGEGVRPAGPPALAAAAAWIAVAIVISRFLVVTNPAKRGAWGSAREHGAVDPKNLQD